MKKEPMMERTAETCRHDHDDVTSSVIMCV